MNEGGRIAYRGFDYQIRVSVWLLLDLLGEDESSAIEIEPLSGQDLELMRSREDHSDVAIGWQAPSLVVQVKGRQNGQWPPKALLDIAKGIKPKKAKANKADDEEDDDEEEDDEEEDDDDIVEAEADQPLIYAPGSPLSTLDRDPEARFLFITDSTLSDALEPFEARATSFLHEAVQRKKSLSKGWGAVKDGILQRIGLWQKFTPDSAYRRADELLAKRFKVPHFHRAACIDALIKRVEDAMLDRRKSTITHEQLRKIAIDYSGCPNQPPVFVAPTPFARAESYLHEHHVLILTGMPGIGKSTAAKKLVYDYRMAGEPYRLVRPSSPAELRGVADDDFSTVIYLEDPFGQYEEVEQAQDWFSAIAEMAKSAGSHLKLVVTSRDSFLKPFLVVDPARPNAAVERLLPHVISFDEESYDRQALLERHVEHSGEGAKWLLQFAETITNELTRPMSYNALATRACQHENPDRRTLEQLLGGAKIDDLGREIVKSLRNRPSEVLMGVAAVWLLLASAPTAAWRTLEVIEDDLRLLRAEVTSAALLLERHGWLTNEDKLVVHPVYQQALRDALEDRRVLRALVVESTVIAAATRDDEAMVLAMLDVSREVVRFAPEARERLTPHLRKWLASSKVAAAVSLHVAQEAAGKRFRRLLQAVARWGADGDPVQLVAAALGRRKGRRSRWRMSFEHWSRPSWDDATYQRIAVDPVVPVIVRQYVRLGLPGVPELLNEGAHDLVGFLYRLTDVSAEFDALVEQIEEFGPFTSDIVASGAARSTTATYDGLVQRAVAIAAKAHAEFDAEWWDEDADAYNDHLSETFQERIKPAEALVDAVLAVTAERGAPDWAASRSEALVFERFAHRVGHRDEVDPGVIRRVLRVCPDQQRPDLVRELSRHDDLLDLAIEGLLRTDPDHWPALVSSHVLGRHRRELEVVDVAVRLRTSMRGVLASISPSRRVAVIHGLRMESAPSELVLPLVATCTAAELDALEVLEGSSAAGSHPAVAILTQVADAGGSVAPVALRALAVAKQSVDASLARWLARDTRSDLALGAIEVIPLAMPGSQSELRQLLRHRAAEVRKAALAALAEMQHVPETTEAIRLIALDDRTPSVRIAAARSLSGDGSLLAAHTLVELLDDSADTSEAGRNGYHYDDDDECPEHGVALAAARSLTRHGQLDPSAIRKVEAFLRSTTPTSRDVSVRKILERVVGGSQG
jgi:hypothetical protein